MKNKKTIIVLFSIFCMLVISCASIFAIQYYLDNKISFTVNDNLPDGQGKKATIILLAGQSNASGCSSDEYLQKNVSSQKYIEYKNGYDNVYINYFVSGQNISQGFVKSSTMQGELGGYFGPELGMAEKLNEMYPDEMFFIIKYAWGGTELYTKWLSPSSQGKTGTLYKQFIKYVETSIKYLESKNYNVKIEGMCWMQGESDSFSGLTAIDYKIHLNNFIKDIRKTFSRYAANDGIAFIDAYIAASPAYWVYYELVNQSKQKVAELSPLNVVIDTISHGLTTNKEPEDNPDIPHYDSMSEIKLGHLFIEELSNFLN